MSTTNTSGKLAWGILSTGAIAKTFARNAAASKTGHVVAVASRSQEKADKFGDEFNIPKRYSSYEALLADPEVQAVYIAPPHPQHAEWAIKAAEAGKHLLVEKPLAVNYGEAMAIVEAARIHNVFLMEAFMYRCHPQTAKLVELLKEKVIGDIGVIQATFSFHAGFNPESRLWSSTYAGGGIMDVGCYAASMARLVAGVATGKPFADPISVTGAAKLNEVTKVDEYAIATLKFPGDILAQLSTGVGLNQENVVRIFGTGGSIFLSQPWVAGRETGCSSKIVVTKKGQKDPIEYCIDSQVTSYTLEMDTVANAIAQGRREAQSPAMSPDDTLGNIRTLDQWRQSAGVVFEIEKPENVPTITRRPLTVSAKHNMTYGKIAGVDKPVSHLVMGVDNNTAAPVVAVLWDDYFQRGGNAFDTAFVYAGGNAEKALGAWIKNRNVRDKVVILDKGAHTPFCDPRSLTEQHKISLDRLQTDYVDIYMMHRDNPDIPVGEFVDVLHEHVSRGTMKAIGPSNWTIERIEVFNAWAKKNGKTPFAAVSNNFSLARMIDAPWEGCISASEKNWRDWLTKTQTPLMPWSSQARGFFIEGRAHPDLKDDKMMVRCWYSDDNFKRLERAKELARKYNVLPTNIALAYVLRQPFPTFPLVGPRQLSEIRTTLPALDIPLTPEELKYLNLED